MDKLDRKALDRALQRVGEVLEYHADVEVLIVGGAAGMVTGVLAGMRTTIDCDVMVYEPASAMGAVEAAGERVAEEMGLPANWLNSKVQIRADSLPKGWKTRRVMVGVYGRLHVFAASRPDLIAMKVLAGRAQDIEDLKAMRVRADDVEFVEGYLDSLAARGTTAKEIKDARVLLASLEVHEDE